MVTVIKRFNIMRSMYCVRNHSCIPTYAHNRNHKIVPSWMFREIQVQRDA